MAPEESLRCRVCGEATSHRLVASTSLHLGQKRKWECEACGRRVVTIDGGDPLDPNAPTDA